MDAASMVQIAVVNPVSGNGRALRMAEAFSQRSRRAPHRIETDADGRWRAELQRLLSEKSKTGTEKTGVLVIGGDGTLSQAACTVHSAGLGPSVELFFAPGGRGNDFARSLYGRAFSGEDFWDWVRSHRLRARSIDLALCNGMPFLNMASVGYGGRVAEKAQERKAFWSRTPAVYQIEGALAFLSHGDAMGSIHSVDGSGASRLLYKGPIFGAFVGNGCANGCGLYWAPDARLEDACLDLIVFPKPRFSGMVRALREARAAQPLSIQNNMGVSPGFRVEFEKAAALELDGESRGRFAEYEFRSIPSALQVLG